MMLQKFKPYSKMKYSGIEEIGEIPEHWILSKVKHLIDPTKYYQMGDGDHGSIKPEMYETEGIPYIRVQNLSWNGKINTKGLVYISKKTHNSNLKSQLIVDDILIAKTGATIGKLGIVISAIGISNTTSSVGKITIDGSKHHKLFYLYFFQNRFFQEQVWVAGIQKSAQPGFNIDDFVDFLVLIPPLLEQQQITKFLDKKISKIDSGISKNQKLVKLLKEKRQTTINQAVTKGLDPAVPMKDSGIEWVGKIPEKWDVKRLKYTTKFDLSTVDRHENDDEIKVSICHYPQVYNNEKITVTTELSSGTCSTKELEKFRLKKDDVLITKDSETPDDIGVPTYVENDFENVVCGYHVAQLCTDKNKLSGNFLFRFIQSDIVNAYFETESNGITRFGLGRDSICNLRILLPSILEQNSISNFIEKETTKIDSIILKIYTQIKKLREYRQSLISVAVTGKIDVRN